MPGFKDADNSQNMILPVNLQNQLIEGTFEHTSCLVIDKIDLSGLEKKYNNDLKGAAAYPPAALLKIILNAYAKGVISSRGIEQLCKENITFMAISGDLRPDHSTIADFIACLEKEILKIFQEVLLICAQCDLIGGEAFALDGCKLPSAAAKEWSGTFKELAKKKESLVGTLKYLMARHKEADQKQDKQRLSNSRDRIINKIDKITEYLRTNDPKPGTRGREVKSNITDNGSAKMHSPHGVIQGYNGLALADRKHQVVVQADTFGNVSECGYLPEVLEQAVVNLRQSKRRNFSLGGKLVLADTNYFSEANCKYLSEHKIDGYIPDAGFRKRDPRYPHKKEESRKKNKYRQEDFTYHKTGDYYICPQGQRLSLDHRNLSYHGYRGARYLAKAKDCGACVKQHKCLQANSKRRNLFIIKEKKNQTYSAKMRNKIDTSAGRDIYAARMGIVEPVFANNTYHKKMNRFNYRGRSKVRIQWILYNLVHNIGKIAKYGNLDRFKNN